MPRLRVTPKQEEKSACSAIASQTGIPAIPVYRFVTVINFQARFVHRFAPDQRHRSVIDSTRKEKNPAKILESALDPRPGRQTLFAVADFDGAAVSQLGIESASALRLL
jgi:hypothetical protein